MHQRARILFIAALAATATIVALAPAATAAPPADKRVGPRVIVREAPARSGPRGGAAVGADTTTTQAPRSLATTPTSAFVVTYDAGFTANPAAKSAFQAAVDIWAGIVVSPVPIRVDARFANLGGGILGSAGPQLVSNFGVGLGGVWYPQALAEAMVGHEIFADPEISAEFNNSSSTDWYFGTDGSPPPTEVDFMTVVLHELGHGLGHLGSGSYGAPDCPNATDGSAQACFPYGPMIFDMFTRTVGGTRLTNLPSPSKLLATAITTPQNVVFDAPSTDATGGPVTLFTPTTYEAGASVGHFDNSYDATGDGLMTPSVGRGETAAPRPLLVAMLKDMGYEVASSSYRPIQPTRLLDTRSTGGAIGAGQSITLPVRGVAGLPSSGVDAVVINVTATEGTAPSYFTVWPTGMSQPLASNLNFGAGETVANLVVAKVSAAGTVSIFNAVGAAHAVVDLNGWMPTGSPYSALTPSRLLDTRNSTPLGSNRSIDLTVTNVGGVPATGVAAVVLNVTTTGPTAPSYFTVWPTGEARPNASNLNFVGNQTVANLVLAKVGAGGRVSIYNAAGLAHAIVDVQGWLSTGDFRSLTPARLLDTRSTLPVGSDAAIDLIVTGRGGVPASGVSAVVLNVTAVGPTAASYLTVWPTGLARPNASNLNFVAGQTVPNLVIAKVGSDGKVSIYNNSGSTHVLVDVMGYAV